MLPPQNRLRKKKEFDNVYKRHQSYKSPYFNLLIHLRRDNSEGRFGFSISKKVGKAVVRNRTKRRLREIIREQLAHLKPGFDAIIVAYPQIAELEFQDLKKEVVQKFKEAGIL